MSAFNAVIQILYLESIYVNKVTRSCRRCTLHPNDSLAMEGPLSRVKSLKKSLRQSFRRIRKSRVSGKKRAITTPTSKVEHTGSHQRYYITCS